jgi:subfamily B ATP-binding cassette protein HlyB/CyaB
MQGSHTVSASGIDICQLHIGKAAFFWALQGLCSLHRKPFSSSLAAQQFAAPYTPDLFSVAAAAFGFETSMLRCPHANLYKEAFPLVAWIQSGSRADDESATPALVLQADTNHVLVVESTDEAPQTIPLELFRRRYLGWICRATPQGETATDPDSVARSPASRQFGFRWLLPELLRHKRLWHEVLLASLVIQLIALATPLFTQAIIDKVVVHHSQSTLIVLAIGMAIFMLFSAALSWVRQYLVLHTGNRVDAILGSEVFQHLFKLPPTYFEHRPTGVIAARLHGVETIREFVSSAAITLILDFPFLLIFVAIMFFYSPPLTLIASAILGIIVGLSMIVAPAFQSRLQEQFQLGARNQAFLTEYISGMETVKSMQMEPQLNNRYGSYLGSYLQASFATKQLANSYNSASNLLEQLMNLLILAIGAYSVMHSTDFSIGMLVAFQMFSARLSQPMLRLVGLWQQFQQARLSIARLGDVMNAAPEPYSVVPSRSAQRTGRIQINELSFRYAEHLPLVYEGLSLSVLPGHTVAIMGPSGCGKSTLAKLLQGFYQPTTGSILIDEVDIRYLSANELRSYFGVVPQETVLFSGSIHDNLRMANPDASFEQVVAACRMAEIHSVIEALPRGYQTEIGERGSGLSGGQKQRIAIARALLKRPAILVFDEATSALDGPTAEHFAATVNALRGKVTMLFITHALPKSLKVDAVFRLGRKGLATAQPSAAVGAP